ncbi:hypothetical protein [Dokdonella sp.]|uniref:hypothetical protein n=1 Tax=Dokdonella sp. TaxID=2291710 RepID=UPI00378455C6
MKKLRFICGLAMYAAMTAAHAGNEPGAVLLEANFNDEPIDQQIGTGGPELGEPISIVPGLSAIVRAGPMSTPSLEFSEAAGGNALSARFEFIGGEEVIHGDLNIHMRIKAAQFDMFDVNVREPGTAAQKFTKIIFAGSGDISLSDENGSLFAVGSYSVNVVHELAILFHMDEGTYDVKLDGVSLVSARAHGVTERGIGSVLLGTDSSTTPGALFYVDRLRVTRGDGIFRNGFD